MVAMLRIAGSETEGEAGSALYLQDERQVEFMCR